jgi:membrane-bound metal-dependent hydrolase YbcI (DUF457 family)
MFIGHFAVGLAAKKAAPKVSLGTLIMSAQFVDLLWPVFLLLGLEHVRIDPGNTAVTPLDFYDYPITHSLVGSLGWSVALGLVYYTARRSARGAWIVGAAVFSHWILDAITHRPDLALYPVSHTFVGLGLWNSLAGTVAVELVMFALGIVLYFRSTMARDRTGRYAFWSLIAVLAVLYVGNLVGPPPPSARALAVFSLGGWLFVAWAYWADRHRQVTAASSAPTGSSSP